MFSKKMKITVRMKTTLIFTIAIVTMISEGCTPDPIVPQNGGGTSTGNGMETVLVEEWKSN